MPVLVNQPFDVLKWWIQALVTCNCQRSEQGTLHVMVLTGTENRVQCQACKRNYYIAGMIPGKDGPQAVIAVDLPQPGGVM